MIQKPAISAPAPSRLLSILAIEDSPYDAELLLHELRRAGLNVRMDVAKTSVEVVALLLGGSYDLVLSDFGLKGWTGLDALHLLRERRPDLPFILVSGSLGDEKAAECIKLGASDFVLKDRLNRLPHAVTRALEDKAQRERSLTAESALRESEERFRHLVEISPEAIFVGCRGVVVFINSAGVRLFGAQEESELVGKTVADLVHPDFQQIVYQKIERHEGTDSPMSAEEEKFRRLDGTFVDVEVSATPLQWKGRASLQVVARDITERKRAEEALRSSEASLRDFVEHAPYAIYKTSVDRGRFISANPALVAMLGYESEAEVLALDLTTQVYSDPRSRPQLLPELLQHERFSNVELEWKRKDGKLLLLRSSGRLMQSGDGERFFEAIAEDITQRAQAEDALRRAERQNALILKTAGEGVLGADSEGVTTFVNPEAARLLGYAPQELVGRELHALIHHTRPDGTPYPRQECPNYAAFRDGLVHTVSDEVFWRKDGTSFPVEYTSTPALDDGGRLIGAVMVFRDITERKRSEAERARLAAAIEQSDEVVLIAGLKGEIEFVNPAFTKVSGYSREEVLGNNPRLLKSGKHDQAFYKHLWDTILAGEIWRGEFINRNKSGSLYTQRTTITPVRDSAGKVANFIEISEDITEHRELEEQLRQAQKMEAVGRLAGGIAHDFNNLLTVIRGYAELMLEETDREKLRSRAQNIIKASDRTAALTRQLLAFSRKQVMWPQVLDLNSVLTEIQKMLPPLLGEDVRVVVIPGSKLGRVKADPGQLEQVLMNLAINARDAMPKGGKLVLETSNVECDEAYCTMHPGAQPGSYVMLAVSDNGCGMDAETQAHIFEPFFTTKPKDKGTGLGLATVYGIVKQSGGHVWVYSEPGAGTTFKVYLPLVQEKTAPAPLPPRFEEKAAVTETILLVEDQEDIRALAREFLEQHGYRVLEARNGAEALATAASHADSIHLLVTDMVMPGMRGRELAEKLCSSRPHMKVLYVSGYTDGSMVENGELGPGSAFLEKPFSSDALARKVRQVLNGATSGCEPPAAPDAAEAAGKKDRVHL